MTGMTTKSTTHTPAPAHCRDSQTRPGYLTIHCSPARGLDAGTEARIEWGDNVLLGVGPHDKSPAGSLPEDVTLVGYVSAHRRSSPVLPVFRRNA